MNRLKRWRTAIARFAEAFDGVDDPAGDYILSLGKRVDKLERELITLERSLSSRTGGNRPPEADPN